MDVDEALAKIRATDRDLTDVLLRDILEEVRSQGYAEGYGHGYAAASGD